MDWLVRSLIMAQVMFLTWVSEVLAQASGSSGDDPKAVVESYSNQMITIFKGPIAKLLSFIILLAGVSALLSGRHRLAVSCGIAFIVLLFIQVI